MIICLRCRKFVHSVDKTTGSRQKSIPYSLAGVGRPYDIVNVPQECPNISNTCQVTLSTEIKLKSLVTYVLIKFTNYLKLMTDS
jgi:hypothetical protein